jgi:hypothetical protein
LEVELELTLKGEGPYIHTFTAEPMQLDPGQPVTLSWSVSGGQAARIQRMERADQLIGPSWMVSAAEGQLVVETPLDDRVERKFVLLVSTGAQEARAEVTITYNCVAEFFFSPAPEGICPAGPPVQTGAKEQIFERGRMVWLEKMRVIYVFYDEDGWDAFEEAWDEQGDPYDDPSMTPPEALYQPCRGFGQLWRDHVRERLGWGFAPEVSYEAVYQYDAGAWWGGLTANAEQLYIRTSDGLVIKRPPNRIDPWEFVG